MSSIILILLMVVFMYFFMIRPQQKQRKEHQSMMSKLRPGDHVVTIGRLHGVVSEVNEKEKTVTLDCEGIYLTFDLVAIQRVVSANKANTSNETKPADTKESPKEEAAPQEIKAEDKAEDSAEDGENTDSAK
ncbi:preprotein translocase subunit YajC [Limosilactobacillus coleohominis]|uniref:Preprotein translocase subunit YajC n=1 Tax=Limosilactobacillus coleohominis TaxID=181675 RepID=A0ABS2GY59_9LACO|nr:preprotein translocase subunit YajC [Limosilactobacillus coleohominis]MBM6940199.1 preprotein translocase subunit YajC [Limosilactobacillus coleohominis]